MAQEFKAADITRESKDGRLPLDELNSLFSQGWQPHTVVADCQSSILVILVRGQADTPEPAG
jgi:hypothetical protein